MCCVFLLCLRCHGLCVQCVVAVHGVRVSGATFTAISEQSSTVLYVLKGNVKQFF